MSLSVTEKEAGRSGDNNNCAAPFLEASYGSNNVCFSLIIQVRCGFIQHYQGGPPID